MTLRATRLQEAQDLTPPISPLETGFLPSSAKRQQGRFEPKGGCLEPTGFIFALSALLQAIACLIRALRSH